MFGSPLDDCAPFLPVSYDTRSPSFFTLSGYDGMLGASSIQVAYLAGVSSGGDRTMVLGLFECIQLIPRTHFDSPWVGKRFED
jgi:hypothetical protein